MVERVRRAPRRSRPCCAQEVDERARVDRAGARGHRHAFERAEAHRRVDRAAVADRGHRAAAAEVADDEARRAREHLGALDGPLHGEPVEAVAADAPVLAPAARDGVGRRLRRGIVAWKAVSKTATCGTPGSARAAAARSPSSAGALCSGAIASSSWIASRTSSSTSTGSRKRGPPCTTRCPTAATSAGDTSSSDSTVVTLSSASTSRSFRLVEPALTTRIGFRQRPGPVADRRDGPRRARASTAGARAARRPSPGAGARPCRRAPGTRSITSITRW